MSRRDQDERVGALRRRNTSRHASESQRLQADALQRCIEALIPLDDEQRSRVLAAVAHLYGLHQLADAITRGALLKPSQLERWGKG